MPPIDPDDLLHQAANLALKPTFSFAGDSPPEEAVLRFRNALPAPRGDDFRRAISACYYALFHALTLACAAHLAPDSPDTSRRQWTRAIGHRDIRAVAEWVSERRKPPEFTESALAALRADASVRRVAEAVQSLQDARAEADYDHGVVFGEPDAVRSINVAREAVDLVRDPGFAVSAAGRLFLGLIALRARGGGG